MTDQGIFNCMWKCFIEMIIAICVLWIWTLWSSLEIHLNQMELLQVWPILRVEFLTWICKQCLILKSQTRQLQHLHQPTYSPDYLHHVIHVFSSSTVGTHYFFTRLIQQSSGCKIKSNQASNWLCKCKEDNWRVKKHYTVVLSEEYGTTWE